jgi:hypothetical protein
VVVNQREHRAILAALAGPLALDAPSTFASRDTAGK